MKPPFDIAADLDTPVSAFLKLAPFQPRFLLESVEGAQRVGRYSIIGFGDAETIRLGAHEPCSDVLGWLRSALLGAPRPGAQGGPLLGGLVGAASYDVVRRFEPKLGAGKPRTTPDLEFLAPRSLLVFDHLTRRVALLHDGDERERRALRRSVVAALRGGLPGRPSGGSFAAPTASLSPTDFMSGVERVQHHIHAGDVYQLVLSVRFEGEHDLDPFEVYRGLRLLNPSPYLYFVDFGDRQVVGSSPEALVKLDGRSATLRPIAGTRPRGVDDASDRANEAELLADPKEAAEHVMLVDLARNDLGRVATAGSVQVNPSRIIERYSHVMHLVSGVQGELAGGYDAFDLFSAAFPAGTLVGAPKVRAMEIIDELEPVARGFYGGTVGYFGHGDAMDQAIAIRTLDFADGRYVYQAGAGIVADSKPDAEHREVFAKARACVGALEIAKEGL